MAINYYLETNDFDFLLTSNKGLASSLMLVYLNTVFSNIITLPGLSQRVPSWLCRSSPPEVFL